MTMEVYLVCALVLPPLGIGFLIWLAQYEPAKPSGDGGEKFTDDEWSTAALDVLHEEAGGFDVDYHFSPTIKQCNDAQRAIDEARVRFAARKPDVLRRHLMDWLDYYEGKIREAHTERKKDANVQRIRDIARRTK